MSLGVGVRAWSISMFGVVFALTACRRSPRSASASDDEAVSDAPASSGEASPSVPAVQRVTLATLTAADLDAYERAMKREAQIWQETAATLSRARTGADSNAAAANIMPASLFAARASAAGMPSDRLNQVADVVNSALVGIMGAQMTDSEATVDLPLLTGEARQPVLQAQADARASRDSILHAMTPDVSAAFTRRRPVLDSLRLAAAGLMLAK